MDCLPQCLEDIIIGYKQDLELTEKYKKAVKQIRRIRVRYRIVDLGDIPIVFVKRTFFINRRYHDVLRYTGQQLGINAHEIVDPFVLSGVYDDVYFDN